MTITKIGKRRYKITTSAGFSVIAFRDSYTGLWRAKQEGGPIDWTDPRRTFAEIKRAVERSHGE